MINHAETQTAGQARTAWGWVDLLLLIYDRATVDTKFIVYCRRLCLICLTVMLCCVGMG